MPENGPFTDKTGKLPQQRGLAAIGGKNAVLQVYIQMM